MLHDVGLTHTKSKTFEKEDNNQLSLMCFYPRYFMLQTVANPEIGAKRKIKKNLAKRDAKKRKMQEKRPGKISKKRKLQKLAVLDL